MHNKCTHSARGKHVPLPDLGRKNYYLKRSGKLALTPAEQQWIINTAKELGVIQSEYFDSYIVEYNWDR